MIIALIFAAIILLQQERLRDLERKNKKIQKQLKVVLIPLQRISPWVVQVKIMKTWTTLILLVKAFLDFGFSSWYFAQESFEIFFKIFLRNSICFRFYGLFPVWSVKPDKDFTTIFFKQIPDLGSLRVKFRSSLKVRELYIQIVLCRFWGQIFKKGVARSSEVTRGQKSQKKVKFWTFMKYGKSLIIMMVFPPIL